MAGLLRRSTTAFLALSLAVELSGVPAASNNLSWQSCRPRSGPAAHVGPLDRDPAPPAQPLTAFVDNHRYNWTSAYLMESMVTMYEIEHQDKWARRLIDAGTAMLAERDTIDPRTGQSYAWADRGPDVSEPYVWAGYTGHVFAPLMEFARFVAEHPQVWDKTYRGRVYRDYALLYMREFNRALSVHLAELTDDGRHATFRFIRHVPVRNPRINGSPLPVNMNAALFSAMLHLSAAEKAIGDPARADQLSRYVADFVRYLQDDVLVRSHANGQTYLSWEYASYIPRAEDLGHANLVAKFLDEAYRGGLGVQRGDLVALANTLDRSVETDGSIPNNLLDGTNISGTSSALYYLVLMAKYLPSLKAKLAPIVLRSKKFEYTGPWLEVSQDQDDEGPEADYISTDGSDFAGAVARTPGGPKTKPCPN
jgi:hypothetical protein